MQLFQESLNGLDVRYHKVPWSLILPMFEEMNAKLRKILSMIVSSMTLEIVKSILVIYLY